MKVSFSPEALAEAEDATRWYRDKGGLTPARAFIAELNRVIDSAREQPKAAATGLSGDSRLHFRRFPYTPVFRIEGQNLRILAIAHQSRRPAYWVGRR